MLDRDGVKILVAPSLVQWAKHVWIETSRFLFWQAIEVEAEPNHEHGASCRH